MNWSRRRCYNGPGQCLDGGGSVGMFKVSADGKEAVRVTVKLGRSSVNTVEILEGLQPGDVVILSDMSQYDTFERVRLK